MNGRGEGGGKGGEVGWRRSVSSPAPSKVVRFRRSEIGKTVVPLGGLEGARCCGGVWSLLFCSARPPLRLDSDVFWAKSSGVSGMSLGSAGMFPFF